MGFRVFIFVTDVEDEGRPHSAWVHIEEAPVISISFSNESGICSLAQTRA